MYTEVMTANLRFCVFSASELATRINIAFQIWRRIHVLIGGSTKSVLGTVHTRVKIANLLLFGHSIGEVAARHNIPIVSVGRRGSIAPGACVARVEGTVVRRRCRQRLGGYDG